MVAPGTQTRACSFFNSTDSYSREAGYRPAYSQLECVRYFKRQNCRQCIPDSRHNPRILRSMHVCHDTLCSDGKCVCRIRANHSFPQDLRLFWSSRRRLMCAATWPVVLKQKSRIVRRHAKPKSEAFVGDFQSTLITKTRCLCARFAKDIPNQKDKCVRARFAVLDV